MAVTFWQRADLIDYCGIMGTPKERTMQAPKSRTKNSPFLSANMRVFVRSRRPKSEPQEARRHGFGAGEIGRGGALRGGCDNPVASPAPSIGRCGANRSWGISAPAAVPVPEGIQR
jgi:hypothetical protein